VEVFVEVFVEKVFVEESVVVVLLWECGSCVRMKRSTTTGRRSVFINKFFWPPSHTI